jgi:hypothetical protein
MEVESSKEDAPDAMPRYVDQGSASGQSPERPEAQQQQGSEGAPAHNLKLTKATWAESLQAAEEHVRNHLPAIQQLLDKGARRSAVLGLVVLSECQEKWTPQLWKGIQRKRLPPNFKKQVENNHLEMQEHAGVKIIVSVRGVRMDQHRRNRTQDTDQEVDGERWTFRHFLPPKHLVYVPAGSPTARALVQHAHYCTAHGSVAAMEAFQFVNYWIPRVVRVMKEVIVHDQAQSFMQQKRMEERMSKFCPGKWQPNPANTPWWGGWYERLNPIIKKKLARLFVSRRFECYDEL